MSRIFFIVFLLTSSVLVWGQTAIRPIKAIISIGGGVNFNVPESSGEFIADELLYYRTPRSAAGRFSGMFFGKNWGVDLSVGFGNTYARKPFEKNLVEQYPDYFVTAGDDYPKDPSYYKFLAGPAYKIERGRLFFIGRFQAGIINLTTGSRSAFLKRKGTNEIAYLEVESRESSLTSIILNPSTTVGYRLFKKFAIGLDVGYSLYKSKSDYTFTSVFSQETSEETIRHHHYNDTVSELTLAVRFMLVVPQKSSL